MAIYDHFSKKNRRLQGFDYRTQGLYFITICTNNRYPYFGEIFDGAMILSDEGQVVHDYWLEIPMYNQQVSLGEFIVMPNHIHGILSLQYPDDTTPFQDNINVEDNLLKNNLKPTDFFAGKQPKSGSISRIIGSYKAACTKMIRSIRTEPFAWQEHFHDRVIRNQEELIKIENYILSNPENLEKDQFYK